MITTIDELKLWFATFELPEGIRNNPQAMERWEKALGDMTLGMIWSFYCCCGLWRYIDQQFSWDSIRASIPDESKEFSAG